MSNDRLKIVYKDPTTLIDYTKNTKKHSEDQILTLANGIDKFGFKVPVLVDTQNVIIAGHARTEASKRLMLKEIPCIVADDWSEEQIIAFRIFENRISERHDGYDLDFMKFELNTLDLKGFDLSLTGLDEIELKSLFDKEEILFEKPSIETISSIAKENEKIAEAKQIEVEQKKIEDTTQWIVTVHLNSEEEMKNLYDRLQNEGLNCKLIT